MTFGSQRLRSIGQNQNLLALYNDVGSLYGEVIPVRGRQVGTAFNLTEASGASGNPKQPSFSPNGTFVAFPAIPTYPGPTIPGGINVWTKTGTNSWGIYDTSNLTRGLITTYDIDENPWVVAFNNAGTRLAVSAQDDNYLCTLLSVPTDLAQSWATVPSDTWATFTNDQWDPDYSWDTVPSDTWATFTSDEWGTSDTTFTVSQKLTTPYPTIAVDMRWSYDDTYLAIAHSKTGSFGSATGCPFSVYKLSGGTYSRLGDPADVPSGYFMSSLSWTPDAVYLAVGGDRENSSTTRMVFYKRSGDTFTKLTDPADMPTATVYSLSFDPSGSYLAVGMVTSPYLLIYKRSGDTFTKLTDPADMPTGRVKDLCWSSDGSYLLAAVDQTNSLWYNRKGDAFTKVAQLGDSLGAAIWPKAVNQR